MDKFRSGAPSIELGSKEAFAPDRVRRALDTPPVLAELPAVAILAGQLERIKAYVEKGVPEARLIQMSACMAWQFMRIDLGKRISENVIGGPLSHERAESLFTLGNEMPDFRREMVARMAAFRHDRSPHAPLRIENDDDWYFLTQGDRGKTAYRFYLAPDLKQVPMLMEAFARSVPPEIGYQMKTFATDVSRPQQVARRDKLIIYTSEETFEPLLACLEKLYRENASLFENHLAPGGGIYVPAPGISIAREAPAEGEHRPTGTEVVAKQLKTALQARTRQSVRDLVLRTDSASFRDSLIGGIVWNFLINDGEWLDEVSVLRTSLPGDAFRSMSEGPSAEDREVSAAFFSVYFPAWERSIREDRPLDVAALQAEFVKALLRARMARRQQFADYFQEKTPERFAAGWLSGRIAPDNITTIAGLTASIVKRFKTNEPISEALKANFPSP